MVAERAPQWYSPGDYLARERQAATKSEYIDGCIVAMAGGSPDHALIAGNMIGALFGQLVESPCSAYSADLRIGIPVMNEYRYPDLVVVCGERELDALDPHTVLNPTLIIEVLSPSTEASDRGEKFAAYRAIPSLRTYLLVAQDQPSIERYERTADGWLLTDYRGLDAVLPLPAIGCTLALRDVYRRVRFPAEPPVEAGEGATGT